MIRYSLFFLVTFIYSQNYYVSPGFVHSDVSDYVEMATTGNAVDFGDMTFLDGNSYSAGNSNGHGGMSG